MNKKNLKKIKLNKKVKKEKIRIKKISIKKKKKKSEITH